MTAYMTFGRLLPMGHSIYHFYGCKLVPISLICNSVKETEKNHGHLPQKT